MDFKQVFCLRSSSCSWVFFFAKPCLAGSRGVLCGTIVQCRYFLSVRLFIIRDKGAVLRFIYELAAKICWFFSAVAYAVVLHQIVSALL